MSQIGNKLKNSNFSQQSENENNSSVLMNSIIKHEVPPVSQNTNMNSLDQIG